MTTQNRQKSNAKKKQKNPGKATCENILLVTSRLDIEIRSFTETYNLSLFSSK